MSQETGSSKHLRLAMAVCASVALAVTANACGGDGSAGSDTTPVSDEAAIRSLISQYQDAVRAKNDATFCSLVTAEYERRLTQEAGQCFPPFTPTFASVIARSKVTDVAVSGGAATATLEPANGSIRLEKVDEDWKIASDVLP